MGKKKLSKKEKARLEAEQAETLRIEMEKERLKKLEEDRERKMRERRDAKKKQEQEAVENKWRRVQLRESAHAFKRSKEDIKHLLIIEKSGTEWDQYMRCNGLPNANSSDLRTYIHMWIEHSKAQSKEEINWLLKTNEQSILTQDQAVLDLSRANLKKLQPEIGVSYAKRTTEVLGILDEMNAVIRDRYSLTPHKMEDLLDLKLEIRTLLSSFIDEFTFKILSNIDRNTTLTGLSQATHTFESSVFRSEIYALRDIPLPPPANPKEKMKEERTHIEFISLQMTLVLPPSVKCFNSAIRGLWLNYDHLSEYCHSSIFKYDDSERKKLTLRQTTKREWKKRKELLQKALHQIFNEKPEESSEEPNQPRVIDVDRMYTEYEDELNSIERTKMGAESLNLDEFEVNLRSHKITGGVFKIEYVEQPLQVFKTDEGALLRTLIHPVQLKKKVFHYPYRPPPPPKAGQRRQPEEVELEIKLMEENMEKMVLVNVDLPDSVSWFEPPTVCRFETDEEFAEVKRLESVVLRKKQDDDEDIEEEEIVQVKHKVEKVQPKPIKEKKIKVIEDFNLLDIPRKVNLQSLFQDFIVPIIPDGYEIKFEAKKDQIFGTKLCKDENIYGIHDIVYQTGQSRSLFQNCSTKKILKVIKSRERFEMSAGLQSSSDEYENDESMYSVDSDRLSSKSGTYMFSKFMRDLEDLIDMDSNPSFEKKIAEISSKLSLFSDANEKVQVDRQSSGFSLSKTNSKSLLDVSSEDSEAESDTDNEDQDEEIAFTCSVDNMVKEANIKRCFGRWSTRDIHDIKFNEDKLTIQFRTGRLGAFALASNRYSNFPYQSWELKPEQKTAGAVIFTLTAAQLLMEVMVTEKGLIVNTLQGSNNPTVYASVIGSTMKLDDLITLLRNSASDVFPDDDAFCYTENSCEKNYVMEMHIYSSMACFALSHNFAWSRWNSTAGSRTCILLMRELIEHRKLPNQSTVHATPFKACLIDCTEVSPNYCSTPIPGQDYYADLYHLASSIIQPVSKTKMDKMNPILRQNILQLLKAVRPLSFC